MSIKINNVDINKPIQFFIKTQKEKLTFTHTPTSGGDTVKWKIIKAPISFNNNNYNVVFTESGSKISTITPEYLILNLSGTYKIEIEETINGILRKYSVTIQCNALKDLITTPYPGETNDVDTADGWARKVERTIQSLSQNEGNFTGVGVASETEEYNIGDTVVIVNVDDTDISGFFYKLQSALSFKSANPGINSMVGIVVDKLQDDGDTTYITSPIYVVGFKGIYKLHESLGSFPDKRVFFDSETLLLTDDPTKHYAGKYDNSNKVLIIEHPLYINYDIAIPSSGYYYYNQMVSLSDWIEDAPDYYIQFSHGLNSFNLMVECWSEPVGLDKEKIEVSRIIKIDENTMRIYVSGLPDGRFSGRINVCRVDTSKGTIIEPSINIYKDNIPLPSGTKDLNFEEGDGVILEITQDNETKRVTVKINSDLSGLGALTYRGAIDASSSHAFPSGNQGWVYRISASGYLEEGSTKFYVDLGDLIICIKDTPGGIAADWEIAQGNGDGTVTSIETPTSGVLDGFLPVFSGASGKIIKKATYSSGTHLLKRVNGVVGEAEAETDYSLPITRGILKSDDVEFTSGAGNVVDADIEFTIRKGDITETTSDVLEIVGGTGAVLGTAGVEITVKQAGPTQNGFLSSTDWNIFNNKQDALTNPVVGDGTTGENKIVLSGNSANTIKSSPNFTYVEDTVNRTLTIEAGNNGFVKTLFRNTVGTAEDVLELGIFGNRNAYLNLLTNNDFIFKTYNTTVVTFEKTGKITFNKEISTDNNLIKQLRDGMFIGSKQLRENYYMMKNTGDIKESYSYVSEDPSIFATDISKNAVAIAISIENDGTGKGGYVIGSISGYGGISQLNSNISGRGVAISADGHILFFGYLDTSGTPAYKINVIHRNSPPIILNTYDVSYEPKIIKISDDGKYVYVFSDTQLMRSENYGNGITNTDLSSILGVGYTIKRACCSSDGKTVYLLEGANPPDGGDLKIFKSTDYGISFSQCYSYTSSSVFSIGLDCSSNGKYVYYAMRDVSTNDSNVYLSHDYGNNFTLIVSLTALQGLLTGIKISSDAKKLIMTTQPVEAQGLYSNGLLGMNFGGQEDLFNIESFNIISLLKDDRQNYQYRLPFISSCGEIFGGIERTSTSPLTYSIIVGTSVIYQFLPQIIFGKIGFFGKEPSGQPTSLTAADNRTIDSTYGADEEAVLNNVRTRLNELESKLKDLGILP